MRVGALLVIVWLALGGLMPRPAAAALASDPVALGACATGLASPAQQAQNAQRAAAANAMLQRYFHFGETDLYAEQYPWTGGNAYSYLWPYSHALQATLDLYQLPGGDAAYAPQLRADLAGLQSYWNDTVTPPAYDSYVRPPFSSGGDRFYDDNVWIGLELADVYRLTGDATALTGAQAVFTYMVSGWDSDPSHPDPGGVFWVDADWDHQRSAVSTATGALLGFELFDITHESYYFNWGWQMYTWMNRYLLAPNGLYSDHINLDGSVDTYQNSYNQGAMLAASALLYRLTGAVGYLDVAERIANAALDQYGTFGGTGAKLAYTNVIFFEELLPLEQLDGNPRYRAAMQAYADTLWTAARTSRDGLLHDQPDAPATLLDQASLVELYATLARTPECAPAPPPKAFATVAAR